MSDTTSIALVFVVYIALMLGIGWWAFRHTDDLADYILGGRRMGRWVSALSAGASDMSGWLLLGLPGYAYLAGFEAGWIALGLLIGTYLNWRIVALRLRVLSVAAGDSLTIPEYLENRFRDQTHVLRIVAAFFTLLFFLFYTSSGLVAGAKLFNAVFELSYHQALLIGVTSILVYTFMGGFLAVSWTDLLQGLLMVCVLLVVPLLAILSLGGWTETLAAMQQQNPARLSLWTDQTGTPLGSIAILSLLGWGLGYFGQPHILARFKAIRSSQLVGPARRIATSWTALAMLGALLVGMAGAGYLTQPLSGADSEKVFIEMVAQMMPAWLAGVCLAAILAAIMSTADSQLLVSASVLVRDFYPLLRKQPVAEAQLVWLGRIAVVLIMLLATYLAWQPGRKVLDLVAYAWAGFGAAFGPVILFSLYWRRMTRRAALAGMLVGGITVVIWKTLSGGIFDLYEIVPGFVLASLVILVVSFMDKPVDKDIDGLFAQLETNTSS